MNHAAVAAAPDKALSTGDEIALLSLIVTVIAVGVAAYTIRRSDLASSGATIVALTVEFRERWEAYLGAREQDPTSWKVEYTFAELMNVVEIACGLSFNRTFSGISSELIQQYLLRCIKLIKDDTDAKSIYDVLRSRSADTYKYIERYEARYNSAVPTPYLDLVCIGILLLCLVLATAAVFSRR
jgi:hypothetical protein